MQPPSPASLVATAFALVLLSSQASSQFVLQTQLVLNASDLADWVPVGIISLLVSFAIVALIYMIAEFLRSAELNAWAKNEVYEVMMTAFIVGMVLVLFGMVNGLAYALVGDNIYTRSVEYLNDVAEHLISFAPPGGFYWELLFYDEMIGFLASLSAGLSVIPVWLLVLGGSFNFFAGFGILNEALVTLIDLVAILHISNEAQIVLLQFIEKEMFRFFLPLGIILRTFPVTRRIGSTIIAVAVTFYIIYPLTLLMINKPMWDGVKDAMEGTSDEIRVFNEDTNDQITPVIDSFTVEITPVSAVPPCTAGWTNPLKCIGNWLGRETTDYEASAGIGDAIKTLLTIGSPFGLADRAYMYLANTIILLSHYMVIVVVLAVVDIIICVSFFRSFSGAIGGDISIPGLARLI
ncbi:MAG: hypothetical protein AB1468_04195 [Candidatus Micrarchaeota archaeon]